MLKLNYRHLIKRIFLFLALFPCMFSAAEVYLVIGSDTAIWNGMNTARFNCTYNPALYTDPGMNAYTVMDPAFRADMVDSYGQPMKMTWWMMAGNIFRYATNRDMPVPNIMTLYMMKKYHGENVLINGDELSLHYHTFYWSDYDNDGQYYWNQSETFLETLDDFKVTLAQFLLEEKVFPVSFRSGWHYMDNDWQNYLDERVLPYSMHNDYPAKRTEDTEPIDNIFDWSQAPSAFVPYHPSTTNYQVPGDGPGWQVRSASFQKTIAINLMDSVFAAAQNGTDQVACFWAHLPENDFPENMQIIDSLAHKTASKYPQVKFRYCTAVEAMQLWRKSTDHQAPNLNFTDQVSGNDVYFLVETDEQIFQQQPFVAIKDIYENYRVLECTRTGRRQWTTSEPVALDLLAKAGVAVCDTMGNQTMEFISYRPDDRFVDNRDQGFAEIRGSWNTSAAYAWGTDSRTSALAENDTAVVAWSFPDLPGGLYNLFIQFPDISNRAEIITFEIQKNHAAIDTIVFDESIAAKQWTYISTVQTGQDADIKVEMSAVGKNQSGKIVAADVMKLSALVRERDIELKDGIVDFGRVSVEDTATFSLDISNAGIKELHISGLGSKRNLVFTDQTVPFLVPPMSSMSVALFFDAREIGSFSDTLEILSDDLNNPELELPVSAEVTPYFRTIDNEHPDHYDEFGEWHTSVANIYGPTSRYAYLNQTPRAEARFSIRPAKSGIYKIEEILPTTVNSTDDALYEVIVDGVLQASWHVNQNVGSGDWVTIGEVYLPANTAVELWVKDTGNSTNGIVIRTDAVRFSLLDDQTGLDEDGTDFTAQSFHLEQNYPNPFNPKTFISYRLPLNSMVELSVYDMLGKKVATLVSKKQAAGDHKVQWDASGFASGIYFYRLVTDKGFVKTRKLVLLK